MDENETIDLGSDHNQTTPSTDHNTTDPASDHNTTTPSIDHNSTVPIDNNGTIVDIDQNGTYPVIQTQRFPTQTPNPNISVRIVRTGEAGAIT